VREDVDTAPAPSTVAPTSTLGVARVTRHKQGRMVNNKEQPSGPNLLASEAAGEANLEELEELEEEGKAALEEESKAAYLEASPRRQSSFIPLAVGGSWTAQGPGPTRNGQVENITPNNEVVGAIHTAAAPRTPELRSRSLLALQPGEASRRPTAATSRSIAAAWQHLISPSAIQVSRTWGVSAGRKLSRGKNGKPVRL